MQYRVVFSKEFNRQYKKLTRSGNERILEELNKTIEILSVGEALLERFKMHKLKGEFEGCFECHILPDWLLIYKKYDSILILELVATGTHSELF